MIPAEATRPAARAVFFGAFARACRPRRRLTVSQWADAHRMLTSKASSEAGAWRTSRTPYLRKIMDCLSPWSPDRRVVFIKPTQVGGTEVGLNWIGYVVDYDPSSMLVVVPTLEVRKRWVRQRLDPMFTETPPLAAVFDARRRRDSANAEDMKDFPGGFLIVAGANSPASLASMPIKYVLCDEVDRFPWEAGKEGDPLGLIEKRTTTFPRRKMLLVSSPTIQGASRIDDEYKNSDAEAYHVPCPHCGERQVLKWGNLVWQKDPHTRTVTHAAYACQHCGAEIEEHHKTEMLKEEGHGGRAKWIPDNPGHPVRGFRINGLYAPLGLGSRWVELANEWLSVQDDPAKLKRFVNTVLGEAWEDRSHDIKPNALAERGEPWKLREIPPGCLVLTCGIDVQGDRLAIQVLGFGPESIYLGIDWFELPGDPLVLLTQAAAGAGPLVEYLARPFVNRAGREMRIEAVAIDTGGHHTHEVYLFARGRHARRLMAVKGSNTPNKPILVARPQAQDINWRGKVIKGGVMLWMVGTDTAKHALYARFTHDTNAEPGSRTIRWSSELPADYFDQLTAEVFDPEKNRWVKRRGRRNEALDTAVYALAAAQHPEIRVHAMRARDWDRLRQLLEPDASPDAPASPAATEPAAARRRTISPGVGKGFVNRWRRP